MKKAVLSYSGGMDSTGVLINLLYNGCNIKAISFDYGQKHLIELKKAKQLVRYLANQGYKIQHTIIKIDGLSDLLHSNLITGGDEVPEGHYEDDNMKQTVVPNRNKIMSSIIQSIALSWANLTQKEVFIAMGIHSGDHEIYPDCRQDFRDADYEAFKLGNWDSNRIKLFTPYLQSTKYDILKDTMTFCSALGLNFDHVLRNTNTSYKPIGNYSDYKSASSVERIEAFIKLGIPDPVQYADKTGKVNWETAKQHALNILNKGENNE